MTGNLTAVVLSTGQTLLAEYVGNGEMNHQLKNPFILVMGPQGQSALVPWPAVRKEENAIIPVNKAHVICLVEPDEAVRDPYLQATGEKKIATPSQGLVLPT